MRTVEERKERDPWQTRAAKLFCGAVALLAAWWILKYAAGIPILLAIAWSVAAVIDPLARRSERRLRLPRKLFAALYVTLLLVCLGLLLFFLGARLWKELQSLLAWMKENRSWLGEKIGAMLASAKGLSAYLPFAEDAAQTGAPSSFGVSVDSMVEEWISRAASELGAYVTVGVGGILRATPKLLIFLVVTVMACYYLSMDYVAIRDFLISLLPPPMARRTDAFRRKMGYAARRYLRAYAVLWLMTFLEVLVGLWILRQPYALLLALLVATVDLLPIVGAGTVLIPWAVFSIVLGAPSFGIGLLILYGVLTIARQIAEPHVVGESLGIHPLASLLGMVTGLQLFGVWGMLLGPVAVLTLKELLEERRRIGTQ